MHFLAFHPSEPLPPSHWAGASEWLCGAELMVGVRPQHLGIRESGVLDGPEEDHALCGLETATHWCMQMPLEKVTLVFL